VKPVLLTSVLLAALAGLHGCAAQQSQQQLEQAAVVFKRNSNDLQVLHDAPKDVMRAAESLERAERFATYWGSAEDVSHYAYLSQRYSEIARQNSDQMQNRRRVTQLAMERERLRQALQEAKLLAMEHRGRSLEDQMISLAADETDRGLVMTLGDVLFNAASAELAPTASRTLFKAAHFLQLNPNRRVRIEGYTDNRGDADENLALSQARAQAVADFLESLGIEARRMEVVGYGEKHRIAENASVRGRAQNRRVEILFSDAVGRLGSPR